MQPTGALARRIAAAGAGAVMALTLLGAAAADAGPQVRGGPEHRDDNDDPKDPKNDDPKNDDPQDEKPKDDKPKSDKPKDEKPKDEKPKHDPWLYDPALIKDGKVASTKKTESGTIHMAYGTYLGIEYAWAWVEDPADPDHHLTLDVDLDGDRRWDDARYVRLGDRQYTPGYPTAKSKDRAFQACVLKDTAKPCKADFRTPWW
ncbi:hypothetical protein CDO52_17670 [Nocardiopsis gilva YIM 90087]|uniref:Uncharacterized protein n=1 Tax=Nocardiopsis gilva YIM 90087 TaxID=1235441 RepID=A0A223S8I0_9ACTN|nr:hypothetical protein [Nocardiopsis gilva]ASU84382.1 hypothetical protein CDO52_17670 [Nocardiopsis gilva YIM 90087]